MGWCCACGGNDLAEPSGNGLAEPTETGHGLDLKFSAEEKDLFFASTTMALGNNQSAKLWEDRWINGWSVRELAPQLYAVRLRP
jgi:hypothetical protein